MCGVKSPLLKVNSVLLILLISRNILFAVCCRNSYHGRNFTTAHIKLGSNWHKHCSCVLLDNGWKRGSSRIWLVSLKDKRQITAVFCCTIEGDFLPVQLIYKGTTRRCHPKHKFPAGWDTTHSKKHWLMFITLLTCFMCHSFPKMLPNRSFFATDKLPFVWCFW